MAQLALLGGTPVNDGKLTFPQWPVVTEKDRQALLDVLESGVWGVHGQHTEEFAKTFAAFQDAKYGVACCNGTVALTTALYACGLEPGDEVIMPPYTFMATATSVMGLKGVPVFVDLEPGTWNIDPEQVESAITERTKALLPVHIGGRPANMTGLMEIAQRHNLKVIEDAAQAHGAQWEGKGVGSFGDCGTFSFQSSKNLTCGEGGLVITNDEEIYYKAWSFHNCGRVPEGAWYQHNSYGQNLRLTQFQAALLQAQFERLPEQLEKREANARFLREALKGMESIKLEEEDPRITRHAHHLFVMQLDSEHFADIPKALVCKALWAEGIPCSPGYSKPLYKEPYMREFSQDKAMKAVARPEALEYESYRLPETERACNWNIYTYQTVLLGSEAHMRAVAQAIEKVSANVDELRKAAQEEDL